MGLAAAVLLLLTLSLSTAAFERLAYRRPIVPVPQVDGVSAHFVRLETDVVPGTASTWEGSKCC